MDMGVTKECAECGKVFTATGRGANRRRFCSLECSKAWWNEKQKQHRRKKLPPGVEPFRQCLLCGKTFPIDPLRMTKVYCSKECCITADRQRMHAAEGERPALTCAFCEKSFTSNRRPTPGRNTFCGNACRKAYYYARRRQELREAYQPKPTPTACVCTVCGKKFTPSIHHPKALTCSKECNLKRQKTRAAAVRAVARAARATAPRTLTCPQCGAQFTTTHWRKKYCSRQCGRNAHYQRYRAQVPVAIITERNRKSRWQGLWLQAIERVGHQCEMCAATEKLQVHHRDGKGEKHTQCYGSKHETSPENLVVLCENCHGLFHHINLLFKDGKWVLDGPIFNKLGLVVEVRPT